MQPIGVLVILIFLLLLAIAIIVPQIQKRREASKESS